MADLFTYLLELNSTVLETNFSREDWFLLQEELGLITIANATKKNFSLQSKHPIAFYSDFVWTVSATTLVCLYSIIFIAAILGNVMVITILLHNKRMRTVTNTFLLNLAISDLLLGVFCMPFTLVGSLLRNFIFGDVMCRLIPYLQAVSVSVSVWTLVFISLERYFAICRPLLSRQWQTISHAYKMIILVWGGSLITMSPIAFLNRLIHTTTPGKYKCREVWPTTGIERAFTFFLDLLLLVVPVFVMSVTYFCIIRGLQPGTTNVLNKRNVNSAENLDLTASDDLWRKRPIYRRTPESVTNNIQSAAHPLIVRGNTEKNRVAKRRVIRMLFVLVVEFVVCWTPLYIVNTWVLYDKQEFYIRVGPTGISVIHLLAYCSSCCNPITYCFMYSKFRKAFLTLFGCRKKKTWQSNFGSDLQTVNSAISARNTIRIEVLGRSEDIRL
ncbi:cholecystokinin receptor type A-like [Tachypleus tridentatus]|uniref:cholecystokinin receptor type A-like n=1 Tax=Tachypleus tridentatus TaxID=6853 RepID=UPI003FCFE6A2